MDPEAEKKLEDTWYSRMNELEDPQEEFELVEEEMVATEAKKELMEDVKVEKMDNEAKVIQVAPTRKRIAPSKAAPSSKVPKMESLPPRPPPPLPSQPGVTQDTSMPPPRQVPVKHVKLVSMGGLRENLQKTIDFPMKYGIFQQFFP